MRNYPIPQQPPSDLDRLRQLLAELSEELARELLAKLEAGDVIDRRNWPLRKSQTPPAPRPPTSPPNRPAPARPIAAIPGLSEELAKLDRECAKQARDLADIDRRITKLEISYGIRGPAATAPH